MEKDFENIGKQLPYRVPDGFFEESRTEIWTQLQQEKKSRVRHRRLISMAVVAIAAALAGVVYLPVSVSRQDIKQNANELMVNVNLEIDNWIQNLSDEELEQMVAFTENDIFLN